MPGIEQADLLIAVTDSDELNLLCCLLAKKAGDCQTIARVRNPVYSQEGEFIKKSLGLSMIINPELAAAAEIARVLRFPKAMEINTFSRGRVEMLKFRIESGPFWRTALCWNSGNGCIVRCWCARWNAVRRYLSRMAGLC